MNLENNPAASSASRRNFMKTSTSLAAAAGLTSTLSRSVHAAEDNKIRVALIGCGGRGTGAAENALQVDNGEIELVHELFYGSTLTPTPRARGQRLRGLPSTTAAPYPLLSHPTWTIGGRWPRCSGCVSPSDLKTS